MVEIKSTLIANAQDHRNFFNTMLGRSAIHHGGPLSPDDIQILINSPHGTMIKQLITALSARAEMLRQYAILTKQKAYTEMEMQSLLKSTRGKTHEKAKSFSAENTATQEENPKDIKTQYDKVARHLDELYGQLDTLTVELTKTQQQRAKAQKQYEILLKQQQSELIEHVHNAGGRLSEPQSAQLQLLTNDQVRNLDQLRGIMRGESSKHYTPMKQIEALSKFFGKSVTPTKLLAMINALKSFTPKQFQAFTKELIVQAEQRSTLQETITNIVAIENEKIDQYHDALVIIETSEKRLNNFENRASYERLLIQRYHPPHETQDDIEPDQTPTQTL